MRSTLPSLHGTTRIDTTHVAGRWSSVATYAAGGFLGGLAGAAVVVLVTLLLKSMMDFVALQATWVLIVVPLIGLTLSTFTLNGIGPTSSRLQRWTPFPPDAIRADITGDVVDSAGCEERFPWRLAPIRTLAIIATVGSGAAMGTEAPAAYLGVAVGAWLGSRGAWWRRFVRSAALGGGAGGVAALMGVPLVGTAYLLEFGRRNGAPLSIERVTAALVGGFVGWAIDVAFGLQLIRLIVPTESPVSVRQAVVTAIFIGAISGAITALAAAAIRRAKVWRASPYLRLALGGIATAAMAMTLMIVASPAAAVGPGGNAILWAENVAATPIALLAVAILRAAMTSAAAAAGGCGGIFVPFLAIGDIGGRVFAPALGVGNDLAGAAGAAGGIAGGYNLPWTAVAMVLWLASPRPAKLTCLAAVVIAWLVGIGVTASLGWLGRQLRHG